jgi:autotransporter-associated beta strand protein
MTKCHLPFFIFAPLALAAISPVTFAVTINIEYTDEGGSLPHPENPSWDPDGSILKAHFQAAKQIWEALLPGEGEIDFDFHWDDDIDGLGLYSSGLDDYVEINPNQNWFVDPTPLDSSEFDQLAQTFYSGIAPNLQASHFPATVPPGALEVGYRGTSSTAVAGVGGFTSQNGFDLLSTVVHEMGHALGLSGVEPGNYNILPEHLGGLDDVEVLEGGGGHLAGQGIVPYLMCEACGAPGVRRFPTATDILIIAEELDITQVRLERVGSAKTGVWSSGSTWVGGAVPGLSQDVYIGSIGNIDLDTNASARNLTIGATEALDVEANTLTVAKSLTFENAALSVGDGGSITADELKGAPANLTTAAGSLVRFNQFTPGSPTAMAAVFAGSVAIGHGSQAAGPVTLASPISNWTVAQNLTIGESRAAIVNVGNAVVWNVGGNLTVGTSGGQLNIQSGGAVSVSGNLQASGGSSPGIVTIAQSAGLNVTGQIYAGTNGRIAYTDSNPRAAAINVSGGVTEVVTVPNPWPGTRYESRVIGGEVTIDGTSSIESLSTPFNLDGGIGNDASGGKLTFKGDAYAMTYQIVNRGGQTGPSVSYGTRAGLGGETRFEGTSRAWSASIRNDAVLLDRGGTGGRTVFADTSSASQATIGNQGTTTAEYRASGTTEFRDSASASTASITNHPTNAYQEVANVSTAPRTTFYGTSTASSATISNLGGVAGRWQGGRTIFRENSTAGNATILNFGGVSASEYGVGATEFRDSSTAGNATIRLKAGYSRVDLRESATAGDAEFIVESGGGQTAGQMNFYNNSKGGSAQFTFDHNADGALFYFYDNSSADQANFDLKGNSSKLRFQGSSTAAQATFDIAAQTAVQFNSNANLGDATFTVRRNGRLDLSGGYNPTGAASVSAGAATISLEGALTPGGGSAGLGVSTWSGVGNAIISIGGGNSINAPGAYAEFDYGGHGENATIIVGSGAVPGALGGNLIFRRGANGENVRVTNQQGALVDISGNKGHLPKTTMGSISGQGTILLSGAELETGSRNTDDTIAGPIVDITSYGIGGKLTKVGTGTLTLAGTNTYTGVTAVNSGLVLVNGSNLGGAVVNTSATLGGTGSLGGAVTVHSGGTLAPGASPGKLSVGSLNLAGGKLAFELGGTLAGTQHDQLISSGAVSLAGDLIVSLTNGFTPAAGDTFNLMDWGSLTGTFTSLSLPTLSDLSWDTSQLYVSGVLSVTPLGLAGDYNRDGSVNAADYTVWRDGLGSGYVQADYNIWKNNYGQNGSQGANTPAVPEPTTAFLLTLGMITPFLRHWRGTLCICWRRRAAQT